MSKQSRIPRVLKNFGVFVDGHGYLGKAAAVKLPKLSRKMEEWRGGGMNAPIELDMGMEKLECEITLQEFSEEILKLWGVTGHDGIMLTLRGALQADDADGTVTPVEAVLRGRWREIDIDEWKPGDASSMKIATAASYYKYTSDGEELIEIDVPNMVENVGGVDRLAEIRNAIGG